MALKCPPFGPPQRLIQGLYERAVDHNLCSCKIETRNVKCAVVALSIG